MPAVPRLHTDCLPRDGRRHGGGPGTGFAFGVFPAEPVVGGFAGVGGVEPSDIRGPRVGRQELQVAGACGGSRADLCRE